MPRYPTIRTFVFGVNNNDRISHPLLPFMDQPCSSFQENGYQLLFLSARSISQAYLTRKFLFNLKQVFQCNFVPNFPLKVDLSNIPITKFPFHLTPVVPLFSH